MVWSCAHKCYGVFNKHTHSRICTRCSTHHHEEHEIRSNKNRNKQAEFRSCTCVCVLSNVCRLCRESGVRCCCNNSNCFRWAAAPTGWPFCPRTSTGTRSRSDASGRRSPCRCAGPPPPMAAAWSGRPADRSAPVCCRSRRSAGSRRTARTGSICGLQHSQVDDFVSQRMICTNLPHIRCVRLEALRRPIAAYVVQHARAVLVTGHQQPTGRIDAHRRHR